jgi:hypothetical protein
VPGRRGIPSQADAEEVLNRYADELKRYPNVNGLGIRQSTLPDEKTKPIIQVYVSKKLPDEALEPQARLPQQLDGIDVNVEEIGELTLQ